MELHGEGRSSGNAIGDETGAKVEQADGCEPHPASRNLFKIQTFSPGCCGSVD